MIKGHLEFSQVGEIDHGYYYTVYIYIYTYIY